MILIPNYITSNEIERNYLHNTSLNHRKKFAQFFTPPPIAELMSKWLLGNQEIKTILEPAFGLGIFSRILLNYQQDLNIKGFEIDPHIFEQAQKIFQSKKNVHLHLQDYLSHDWENKYDGIIGNPPYFKFHDYENKDIIKDIEAKINCKLNGFTNLYALFLVKSVFQLNINGRAAYIIPSEFLNSDYGRNIKSYLIKNRSLRHIIIIDFEENAFDDALTTASIFLFANDNHSATVNFTNVNNLSDLKEIEKLIKNYPNCEGEKKVFFAELNASIKWRAYYQIQNSIKYKNLVPFANYGKVVRGIATGANEYFLFNLSKAKEYNIEKKSLLPCIGKSTDVKSSFFTEDDFKELEQQDKYVFLFNAMNSLDDSIKKYIEKGVKEGIQQKYLTSSRNPWYSLENRQPSPIWISVFNRNGLRFVRNEANISNLTTFHCLYLNLFSAPKIDLLFAYLLTDVAKEIFNDNRREYGNGLKKFEPNDLNKAKILNLELLDAKTETKIVELYRQYRQSEISKEPEIRLLTKINDIYVDYFSLNSVIGL